MTPTEILDAARNRLNASDDDLWSEAELLQHLYECQVEFCLKVDGAIQNTSTVTTTTGTSQYTVATNAIELLRVEYDGTKIQNIDQRQQDSLTPNWDSVGAGTPSYYRVFNDIITLYPVPDDAKSLKQYTNNIPDGITTINATISIPVRYHRVLVDGLTAKMTPKDLGHPLTAYYEGKWQKGLEDSMEYERSRKRSDRFAVVKTEEEYLATNNGII